GELCLSLGELEPPVADLVLTLPPPPPALHLAVVDDASGVALDTWTVFVRGERAWEELDDAPESLALASWNADTAFAVCSPGYRAWVASPGTPRWPAPGEDRVVARLERGWSALFLARSRGRGEPVEGVEVRLDGAPTGTTDMRGELWVHADAPAERLEVAH